MTLVPESHFGQTAENVLRRDVIDSNEYERFKIEGRVAGVWKGEILNCKGQ